MNSLVKFIKNSLLVVNSKDYIPHLYKLCMEKVKTGSLVLLITSEYYDISNLVTELTINKDELKNFILMYYQTIDEITCKLLLLHNWSLLPTLVVVDLSQLLRIELETCLYSTMPIQKVALCTVSLLAYLQSIALKIPEDTKGCTPSDMINGLLIVRAVGEDFGNIEIQTLKDLYFYKTELCRTVEHVRDMMPEKSEKNAGEN